MSSTLAHEAGRFLAPHTNLSLGERAASVVGGLALAAIGAQPRPSKVLSLVAILAGAALAIRGATGYCAAKAMAGDVRPSALPDRGRT